MKQLKISFSTGKIEVPDLPGDDASAEDKNARALALLDETSADLDELDKTVDQKPREALLQAWILQTWLEAHPKSWLSDFGKRRERNALDTRLGELKDRAIGALPGDEGQTVWDDLPYVRTTLELLFAKQRTSDEVKRLILSPLGKLKNANIDYQRQGAEDLARVCADISQIVRSTANLDDEVKAWGLENREALLLAQPPVKIPASRVDSLGPAKIGVVLAGLLIIAGGAITAGMVSGVPATVGFGLLGASLLPLLVGVMTFRKVSRQRAAVPTQFSEDSQRFRERLYLICCLRTLFQLSSRYTVTDEAFRTHLNANGGKTRWKKVKFEARDLTELFATESWDPRGTVEHWLAEKVKTTFRLDSTKLIGPEDLDVESWDVLLRAYLLESIESQRKSDTEAQLLDTVSEMLFVKRGEDIEAEKQRVFEQVRKAWAEAERAEGRAL